MRLHVGAVEIALAEVNVIRAGFDRDAPIVVDDKLRAGLAADRSSASRISPAIFGSRAILDAQLDELRADADEPRDPGRAVDDRIETIEAAHESCALPSTGVEGAAMSRGSIGPAR